MRTFSSPCRNPKSGRISKKPLSFIIKCREFRCFPSVRLQSNVLVIYMRFLLFLSATSSRCDHGMSTHTTTRRGLFLYLYFPNCLLILGDVWKNLLYRSQLFALDLFNINKTNQVFMHISNHRNTSPRRKKWRHHRKILSMKKARVRILA